VAADSILAQGTVFIVQYAKDKEGKPIMKMCTGSLIDDNIVLTAAHCVPSTDNANQVEVAFSLDPVCQVHSDGYDQALRKAEKVIHHPDYNEAKEDSENDLAMIRFAGQAPAGKTVLKLQTQPVDLNENSQIVVVGYGKTTDYNQEDSKGSILRTASIAPVQTSDVAEKITKDNTAKVLYFDQTHGQGACSGDSGGPTLLKTDEGFVIIGVNSAVDSLGKGAFDHQENVTCHQGLRSTSILGQREWILNTYSLIKNDKSNGMPLE
jgi:secreted trypsin-like serine protease